MIFIHSKLLQQFNCALPTKGDIQECKILAVHNLVGLVRKCDKQSSGGKPVSLPTYLQCCFPLKGQLHTHIFTQKRLGQPIQFRFVYKIIVGNIPLLRIRGNDLADIFHCCTPFRPYYMNSFHISQQKLDILLLYAVIFHFATARSVI